MPLVSMIAWTLSSVVSLRDQLEGEKYILVNGSIGTLCFCTVQTMERLNSAAIACSRYAN